MPDLDLSWPSPELAQESAAILSQLDLPTSSVNGSNDDPGQPLEQIWAVREIQCAVNAAMTDHERRTNGAAMTPDAQRQLAMKLIVREIDDRSVARGMQGQGVMSDAEERLLRTAVFAAMFGLGHRLEALLDEDLVDARPVIPEVNHMPDLDLVWPSPELAQESAAILGQLDLPTSSDRGHDEDGTYPRPADGDDR